MTAPGRKPHILALIPARGGSKGIPRKNLLRVGGKPLIWYAIDQAKRSRLITRVVVSTDDAEIAAVARESGAEVPFIRPAEFAQDMSPDIDVFRHALLWLREHEGYRPDLVVHLRPTGPVRRVALIDDAIATVQAHPEADSLRALSPSPLTPFKMWFRSGEFIEPVVVAEGVPDSHSMARQLLPQAFWQNGYVDIVRPRTVLEMNSMAGKRVLPFVVTDPIYELDYVDDVPALEEALARLARGESIQLPGTGGDQIRHAR